MRGPRYSRNGDPDSLCAGSCVSFVKVARRGKHTDLVLEACRHTLRASLDRFPQLGAGWVLRELTLCARDETLAFLRDHYAHITREALRYALEKLDPPTRTRIMDEHKSTCRSEHEDAAPRKRRRSASGDEGVLEVAV